MFFTKDGLEQASHEDVARYHASRFPEGEWVADLTCGIGSDTIALTQRGPVVGYELDAQTAWCARRNVCDQAEIVEMNCLSAKWTFPYAFVDPSRRVASARTRNPNEFSPNPMELTERLRDLKFAGMKLSPMLADDTLAAISSDVEFVSFRGECREAIAWFGGKEPGIRARKIETGAVLSRSESFIGSVESPFEYLYEADPAAIRAHCLGTLCETYSASPLGDSNGYLTSDLPAVSEWLRTYRVKESGNFDEKRVRRSLAALGGGAPIIKSRGVPIDMAKLTKSLTTPGPSQPIVVLYGVGKSVRFLIVEAL